MHSVFNGILVDFLVGGVYWVPVVLRVGSVDCVAVYLWVGGLFCVVVVVFNVCEEVD